MVPTALERLFGEVPVQIVRVREIGILSELVADIVQAAIGGAVADRIVTERLIERQRMRG